MIVSLFSCGQELDSGPYIDIIILHNNDAHGSINNFDKIAYLVEQYRNQYSNVFLVAGGDSFNGNSVVDQYPENGYPMIDLMNRIGYDLTVIGNKDFVYGQSVLNARMEQANFPFICANFDSSGAILNQPQPYITLSIAEGIKLTFIGAVQIRSDGIPSISSTLVSNINFINPISAITAHHSLKQPGTILIALTHIGLADDFVLAQQMPELDLIIGGHSHSLMEANSFHNGVLISQSGRDLQGLGIIHLKVINGVVTEKSSKIIDLSTITETDPAITTVISNYNY